MTDRYIRTVPSYVRTAAHRQLMSNKLQGLPKSEETKRRISETMKKRKDDVRYAWTGGKEGDTFAAVLCPAGFVREHIVWLGLPNARRAVMDFAHIEGKVNIEIDGLYHASPPWRDEIRDAALKALGWKVIRIRA